MPSACKSRKNTDTQLQVWKSNDLVRSTMYEMPTAELKLLISAISRIKRDGDNFQTVVLTVKELAELMGIERSAAYSDIKHMGEALASRTVHLFDHESREHKWLNWCDVSYVEGSGCVRILFRDVLKPYLLQLKEKFVHYGLENIIRLTSSYHIRLYEYLKSWESVRNPLRIKLIDLRRIVGAESKAYDAYFTFNGSVLKPAHLAIEKHTDLHYTYKPIKQGRSVVEIEFKVKPPRDLELPFGENIETTTNQSKSFLLKKSNHLSQAKSNLENSNVLAKKIIDYWNIKMTSSPIAVSDERRITKLVEYLKEDPILKEKWQEMIDEVAESKIWNGYGPRGRNGSPFYASFSWFLDNREKIIDAVAAREAKIRKSKKKTVKQDELPVVEPAPEETSKELAKKLRSFRHEVLLNHRK